MNEITFKRDKKILLDKGLFKISNRSTNPTFVYVALTYNSYTLHRYLQLIHLVADYSHICITKMLDIKKTEMNKKRTRKLKVRIK